MLSLLKVGADSRLVEGVHKPTLSNTTLEIYREVIEIGLTPNISEEFFKVRC